MTGSYESSREIATAAISRRGGGLEVWLSKGPSERELVAPPDPAEPDELGFSAVTAADALVSIEFEPTDDRRRSFRAWGADKLPDDHERRELKSRIEGMVGFPERPLLEHPSLEDVDVPAPRLDVPDDVAGFRSTGQRDRVTQTDGRQFQVRSQLEPLPLDGAVAVSFRTGVSAPARSTVVDGLDRLDREVVRAG